MPDTSKLSRFLKADQVKDGDVITFVDAGIILEKEFDKNGQKEKKPVLEITVRFHEENKTYSPNGTSVKLLNAAWGTNTDDWVGKKASLLVLPASNGKDMVVAKPVSQ